MKSSTSKFFYFSLLYIAITIPFQWKYLPFSAGIILLGLIWLFDGNLLDKIRTYFTNPLALIISSVFWFYLISIIYSDNKSYGFNDLLLKSPILFLPLFLSTKEKLSTSELLKVLKAFAFSTFFADILTFSIGLFHYAETGMIKFLFYHDLTLFMHSAYYALYTLFSIVIFVYFLHHEKQHSLRIIYSVIIVLLLLFMFLLSSRMQLFLLVLLLFAYILGVFYYKKKLFIGFLILIGSGGIFYGLLKVMPRTNQRWEQTKQGVENLNHSATNSDARVQIWYAASRVIQKNFAFGTGNGDVKDKLLAEYGILASADGNSEKLVLEKMQEIRGKKKWIAHIKQKAKENNISLEDQLYLDAIYVLEDQKNRYNLFIKQEYNYHSQILQTFAATGIFGILGLLFAFAFPFFFLAIKKRQYLLLAFLVMVGGSFISESMLERQAGVILFAFFISLLLLQSPSDKHA